MYPFKKNIVIVAGFMLPMFAIGQSDKVKGGQIITLNSNSDGDVVIWLSRHI